MEIAWVARNEAGIVRAFSHVAYTDRETLVEIAEIRQSGEHLR